jgi:16S rRNA (cytosine1402-N4)-methyltransferase
MELSPRDLHTTVLLEETTAAIAPVPGGTYIDATLGLGGHAESVLEASQPNGRVLGIDRDPEALRWARARLARFGSRFTAVEGSFSDLGRISEVTQHRPADGVIADLGVSSLQLDHAERGFSFQQDGPLDMRMGPSVGSPLSELLADIDEAELARVLRDYGEVSEPRRVARALLVARNEGKLLTTFDLKRVVERVASKRDRHRAHHPATKVFQALRIATNREIEELESLLEQIASVLSIGGRAAIITFHSLEDRAVKHAFRDEAAPPMPRGLPIEPTVRKTPLAATSKKPIVPSEAEVDRNPRARSAKLRAAVRVPIQESR